MKEIKTIIAATDFSIKAQYAVNFAYDLAKRMDAKVILFHRKSDDETTEQIDSKLRSIHKLHDEIPIEIIIESGKYIEVLAKLCDRVQPDLVLMGAKGLTDEKDVSIGSRSQKAVRLLDYPIIFVSNAVDIEELNSIIFASNFNSEAKVAFEKVVDLAKAVDAEIHLLTVDAPAFFHVPRLITRQSMKGFVESAGEVKCIAHDIEDISVISGIQNFTSEVNANLVSIGTYGKKARIFSGSVAEALVDAIDIPVMTINLKN